MPPMRESNSPAVKIAKIRAMIPPFRVFSGSRIMRDATILKIPATNVHANKIKKRITNGILLPVTFSEGITSVVIKKIRKSRESKNVRIPPINAKIEPALDSMFILVNLYLKIFPNVKIICTIPKLNDIFK